MDQLSVAFEGLQLSPLKIIKRDAGNIMHAVKNDDPGFAGFGEAYFTFVNKDVIKGWKKHRQMTLNLIVPLGAVRFMLFDDRPSSATHGKFSEVTLSRQNYHRLTVQPDIWIAFKGLQEENMVLNVANIKHDPTETIDKPVDHFVPPYANW